jgi:hypothetical protein
MEMYKFYYALVAIVAAITVAMFVIGIVNR